MFYERLLTLEHDFATGCARSEPFGQKCCRRLGRMDSQQKTVVVCEPRTTTHANSPANTKAGCARRNQKHYLSHMRTPTATTHAELLVTIRSLARDHTPEECLRVLRTEHDGEDWHETYVTFYVWAVSRLATAGLSDAVILQHPLCDSASIRSWYSPELLATTQAAESFVEADLAVANEPAPTKLD